jgi:hypothetical protein
MCRRSIFVSSTTSYRNPICSKSLAVREFKLQYLFKKNSFFWHIQIKQRPLSSPQSCFFPFCRHPSATHFLLLFRSTRCRQNRSTRTRFFFLLIRWRHLPESERRRRTKLVGHTRRRGSVGRHQKIIGFGYRQFSAAIKSRFRPTRYHLKSFIRH